MRWLFIFLVFINLFFALWVSQQPTSQSIQNNKDTTSDRHIASISLLSEEPEQAQKIKPVTNPPQALPNQETHKEPITCLYIGGVTKQTQLTPIHSFLQKQNDAINLSTIKLHKASRIRLFINSSTTPNKQALLEQLNRLSINYMVIARGPLKDDINLGAFIAENDYKSLVEKLKESGVNYEMVTLPNASSSYWLKVSSEQRTLLTEQLLANLMGTIPSAQQELMPCELKFID